MPVAIALLAGVVFGVGLTVSDMVNPAKVIAFLDVTGAWDPSLAFTMIGALAVTVPVFAITRRMDKPLIASQFSWPTRNDIDARLLGGAALFGVGWGLSGFCPGPAVASLSLGYFDSLYFVGGLIAGTLAIRLWEQTRVGGEPSSA